MMSRCQGKRKDLEDPTEELLAGTSYDEVALAHPKEFVKYARGFRELSAIVEKRDIKKGFAAREVWILYGPPGTGKSRYAEDLCEDRGWTFYRPQQNNNEKMSFETIGREHKAVILDEFDAKNLPLNTIKVLCDGRAVTLPGRNTSQTWNGDAVIFTSNDDPRDWYPNASEDNKQALWRRVTHFYRCEANVWKWDHPYKTGDDMPNPYPELAIVPAPRPTKSSSSSSAWLNPDSEPDLR